jgi:hypothetical protein
MRQAVLAFSIAMLAVGASGESRAQNDFMSTCQVTASQQTCACMQRQIPADKIPAAVAAMRKSNAAMSVGGNPLDPSTLPPAEMQGLQQVVLAQAACM